MLNVRLAGDDHLYVKLLFSDIYDGVISCCLFSQEMSWTRSGINLSQFLRGFISTFDQSVNRACIEFSM